MPDLNVDARAASLVRDQGILNMRDEVRALKQQVTRTYELLAALEGEECDEEQAADLRKLRKRLGRVAAKPAEAEPVEA